MTDRELMQMVLDWADNHGEVVFAGGGWNAVNPMNEWTRLLRARLAEHEPDDGYCQACDGNHCTAKNGCVALDNPRAQPEPEPVAWLYKKKDGMQVITDDPDYADGTWTPLYTAPPQREWQGLTDEEIEKLYLGSFDEGQFARAIEAKLKEKNA